MIEKNKVIGNIFVLKCQTLKNEKSIEPKSKSLFIKFYEKIKYFDSIENIQN